MAARKFKFISPGIYLNEVDESILERTPPIMGPVVIGRTRKGPAFRPVTVDNYSEFVDIFGDPVPGPEDGDVWRSGVPQGPTYAAYAAKAYLNSDVSPLTMVRLLGEEHASRAASGVLAGWKTTNVTKTNANPGATGGAFGLWVTDSGSAGTAGAAGGMTTPTTGTLAAIWYLQSGSTITLRGVPRGTEMAGLTTDSTGSSGLFVSDAEDNHFRVKITNYSILDAEETSKIFKFNFTPSSKLYIRNAFNTNPVLTNSDVVNSSDVTEYKDKYWLGETFERAVNDRTTSTIKQYGMILGISSGSVGYEARLNDFVNPQTGWFFSQDFGVYSDFKPPYTCTKLFRFHSRDYGIEGHKIKIAIEDIKASPNPTVPYGSFTVAVYPIETTDKGAAQEALERYTNCNLNPNSPNYVARRVGDKYLTWSYTLNRHTENGQYNNISGYIRIEMNPVLDVDFNEASLPYGITGPIVPQTFHYVSGSATTLTSSYHEGVAGSVANQGLITYATGGQYLAGVDEHTAVKVFSYIDCGEFAADVTHHAFTGSWSWPAPAIRSSSTDTGINLGETAYFGVQTTISKTSKKLDRGFGDYLRGLPFDSTVAGRFDDSYPSPPAGSQYAWVFTLDDLRIRADGTGTDHVSGSRADGTSKTAADSDYSAILATNNRFWTCMAGGHDGLDVTEAEPFRNSQWTVGASTQYSNYAWNSVYKAIKTVSDQDVIEYNMITAPGITNNDLTDEIIELAQERADALAIIDLVDVFTPSTENTSTYATNLGSVTATVSSMKNRDLNNSYGCTYYPWAQIRDTRTNRLLWVPPSVVALGTMGSSQAVSELWFAPAGFRRGGLTEGSAGVPVVSVSERLTQKQRDSLYENNINPIARFPSEGIVIFGQKTLQATPSALDRVNVRRLMIYLKKEISRMATKILFDQNVQATWSRFTGMVNPFMASVQSRFGVTEYRVILDETTTTPDLIDRNILYAKIFIKPARAIEFIALDFIISKTGASFND